MGRTRADVRAGSLALAPALAFALILFQGFTTPAGAQPPLYVTQWGEYASGYGQFADPNRVATDAAGNVYVSDSGNSRIQKFTSDGVFLTQWNPSGGAGFFVPYGVATDAAHHVFVADHPNSRILRFTDTGTFLGQFGGYGTGNGQFAYVNGVATDHEGNVYVADLGNNRIQKFTNSGAYLTQWGSSGIGDGQFDRPFALATDGAGNVYVCDYNNGRVQKFTSTGTFLAQLGQYGSFYNPTDVATDADGNVYVAESINCRIQKFTGTGAYLAQWGTQGSGNGEFFTPFGITVNAAGDVYVVDTGNNRIQKFATPHVSVDLALPGTINVRSMGKWVTAYLQPPAGFDASAIDASSIRLFGNLGARPLAVDATSPSAIGDQNGDGVPDLMVKFDRGAFDLTVFGTSAQVAVNGMIAGQAFGGVATIKVLRSEIIPPPGGVAYAGMVTTMRWLTPPGADVQSVAVLWSLDDGASWTLEASGLPNLGSYDWLVPTTELERARFAVVLVESADATGDVVNGVLGVSPAFAIRGLVGVGEDARPAFRLEEPSPNPWRGGILTARFALAIPSPATLELLDMAGRRIASREVEALGVGRHAVDLSEARGLAPGLYFLRLKQGASTSVRRLAVLQ